MRSRPLRRQIRLRRDYLRGNVKLWGTTGYAFHTLRDYRAAIDWLADWRERKGVEAWMLVNIAEPHRALGNVAEAHAISEHAITLGDEQSLAHGIHLLWLACDATLANDLAAAEPLITRARPLIEGDTYPRLADIFDGVLALLRNSRDRAVTLAARTKIQTAISSYPNFRKDDEVRRSVDRLLRHVAASGVDWRSRWWCWRTRVG